MGLFRSKPKYSDETIRQAIKNLAKQGMSRPTNHAIEDECEMIVGRNSVTRHDEKCSNMGTAGRK